MKHFLSIEGCHQKEIIELLSNARAFKADRLYGADLLAGQSWVLIFSKPSTRTRISFEVGLRELGGGGVVSSSAGYSTGTRRADQRHSPGSWPNDTWRRDPDLCPAGRRRFCSLQSGADDQCIN